MSEQKQDATTKVEEGENKETSTAQTEDKSSPTIKVNSANDWEHADLGDKSRKDKFLKLMGAAKEDHTGKIVIGESVAKHKADTSNDVQKGLEEQFQQGLEHKLKSGYKGHIGLGFSQDDKKSADSPRTATPEVGATPDTDVVEERRRVNDDIDKATKETGEKAKDIKRTAEGDRGDAAVPKKKPMMNFVKASDS